MHGGREAGSFFDFRLISVDHCEIAVIPMGAPWVSYLGRCRKAEVRGVGPARGCDWWRLV